MSVSNSVNSVAHSASEPFIVTDVGGTHARIALANADPSRRSLVELHECRTYKCADYPGLGEILRIFLAEVGAGPVRHGVIASAGYALEDGSVIVANLPWKLAPEQIRLQLGMQALHLVNDFEAVAHAAGCMADKEVLHLSGPRRLRQGPILVVGPGTGLGAALWIPRDDGPTVLVTEAGHAALAAGSDLELELLKELRRTHRHVATEQLLSGPGLLNIYRTLCALRAVAPSCGTPIEVTAAALSASEPLARQALDIFCGLLGSVVGDMALLYGVRGGIYLAGGFLPQIAGFLAASEFGARLLDKGKMRPALERVPVKLVEHGQLGMIGAASWFLRRGGGDIASRPRSGRAGPAP